jgi:hypothetical protein
MFSEKPTFSCLVDGFVVHWHLQTRSLTALVRRVIEERRVRWKSRHKPLKLWDSAMEMVPAAFNMG